MGTPVIKSGPFVLTQDVLFTTDDPAIFTAKDTSVQIQNSSGFPLTANLGAKQYLIQPFIAATNPLGDATEISIVPGQAQSPFGVLVSFAWMQPGETPPMPDGPLYQGNTSSLGVLTVTETINSPYNVTKFLSAPPLGYAWSLYSVAVSGTTATEIDSLSVTNGSLITYLSLPDVPLPSVQPLDGLPVGTEVAILAEMSGGTTGALVVTLRYDLFPAPTGG